MVADNPFNNVSWNSLRHRLRCRRRHPEAIHNLNLAISSAFRPAAIKRALDQPRFEVMREKAAQEKAADRELKRAVAVTVRSRRR